LICLGSSVFGQTVALTNWSYREDAPAPGAYVNAEVSEGFQPYQGRTLDQRSDLKDRMYTFRTDLVIEAPPAGQSLALMMGAGNYPRDVYFNGVLLRRTGDHGATYNPTVYYATAIFLPPQLIHYGQPNKIAVEAFPRNETSALGDLEWGRYPEVAQQVFWRDFFNLHMLKASVVVAGCMFLYFVFLFFTTGRTDRRYLYFSLMAVSFLLSYLNMTFWNEASDVLLLEKASRTGLPLTTYFLGCFAIVFTGYGDRRKWLKPVLFVPILISSILVLLQPDKQGIVEVFSGFTTNLVLTPGLLLTLGVLVFALIRKPSVPVGILLGGYLVTIATSLFDISFVNSGSTPYAWLVPYGYLALVLAIFFVLAFEQTRVLRQLAAQSTTLNLRNESQGQLVQNLTKVSQGLVDSSSRLSRTIDETLAVVESYGEDNKSIADSLRIQTRQLEEQMRTVDSQLESSSRRVPEAMDHQAEAVDHLGLTMGEMNTKIQGITESAQRSHSIAVELARSSESGARVIAASGKSIANAALQSERLKEILRSIEDIAARTHILAINAAIESARVGNLGRGFAVVASEVRNLANQSQLSLSSSFESIQEMSELIQVSSAQAAQAVKTLEVIQAQSLASSRETAQIRELLDDQRTQSQAVIRDTETLREQSATLQQLAGIDKSLNQDRRRQFSLMQSSFQQIEQRLGDQEGRKEELASALDRMRRMTEENAVHLRLLEESIQKTV